MSAHAKYAPSSAHRLVVCHASARMEAQYPDEDSADARAGTAVHWAGAELLHGADIDVGQVAENGEVLNIEMVQGAELWANTIKDRGEVGSVEETLVEPALHPDNWGTPDHWLFDWSTMTLHVDDLKFGHRFVDVYLCWQLMNYAALILKALSIDRNRWREVKIVFTLVLPRCYHASNPVQEWRTTWAEIEPYVDQLQAAMYAADSPDAKCNAIDVEACRDCKARFDCEANIQQTAIAASVVGQPTPLHMSPSAKVRWFRVLREAEKRVTSMREGMEQDLIQTIRRKQAVPFFGLENRPGREVFREDAERNGLVQLAGIYGVDVFKKRELITPKQAIDAGIPADMVKLYTERRSGSTVLVEDDGSDVARIFNQGGVNDGKSTP